MGSDRIAAKEVVHVLPEHNCLVIIPPYTLCTGEDCLEAGCCSGCWRGQQRCQARTSWAAF